MPSDAALALVTFMAVHAKDEDGYEAWASHSWKVYAAALGREHHPATETFTESDRRAVKRALDELLRAGLLVQTVKAAPGVTARYRLVLAHPTWDTTRPPISETAETATGDTTRPASASAPSVPDTPNVGHRSSGTGDTARPQRETPRVPLIQEIPEDEIHSREDEVTGDRARTHPDTASAAPRVLGAPGTYRGGSVQWDAPGDIPAAALAIDRCPHGVRHPGLCQDCAAERRTAATSVGVLR